MMTRFLILILVLTFGAYAPAQQTGAIKFQVDNANGYFEILVNDTLVVKQYTYTLPVGTYSAKAWSYGYDVEDFSFTVLPDTAVAVYVKLNRSADYTAYEKSYQEYRMKFHKSFTVPVSATLTSAIAGTVFMMRAFDLRKEVTLGIASYYDSPSTSEIAQIKQNVIETNNRYNTMRTAFYITAGLTGLGVITTIYTATRFKQNTTEPGYSRQSPFDGKMSLNFTPNGYGLIIKLG